LTKSNGQVSDCFDTYQQIAQLSQLRDDTSQMTKICLSEISHLLSLLCLYTLDEEDQVTVFGVKPKKLELCIQDIMWNIAIIVGIQKINLQDLAYFNSLKIADAYPICKVPTKLEYKEADFPKHERFPSEFTISIVDMGLDSDGKQRSRMYWNGKPLGDDLKDNANYEDGYRFHDILHLAFIAKFGWSPVVRAMMKCKRKSQPHIDEVEDGARARITEELVAKLMHSEAISLREARQQNTDQGQLFPEDESFSSDFYRSIKRLVSDLEVQRCKHWEWEEAAHEAFAIYDRLCVLKEGQVEIKRPSREITFSPDLIFDVKGICINQALDNRVFSENGKEKALVQVARKVIDSLTDFDNSDFKFHEIAPSSYVVQTCGDARKVARQKKILTIKVSQSFTDQSIVTFATALGDPVDFQ